MRADQERREKESGGKKGGRRTDGVWHNTGVTRQLLPLPLVSPLTSCSAIIQNAEFKVGPSAFSLVLVQLLQLNLIKTFIFTLLISSLGSCLIM